MKKLLRCWMLGLCLLSLPGLASAADAPLPFVHSMQTVTSDWRGQLVDLTNTADEASAKLIAGGNVYVASTQKSFEQEVLGRAGGLMLTKELSAQTKLTSMDTVLAAMDSGSDPAALDAVLAQAKAAGAKVLLFAGPSRGKVSSDIGVQVLPSKTFDNVPYANSTGEESVGNVIGVWTWMAELVATSVRRGHMPTAYTSNFMPGALERNAQFSKRAFHTTTDVTPASVRRLGARYLDALSSALASMNQSQSTSFMRGAKMIRDAVAGGHHVDVEYLGHMFPTELQGPGRPDWQVPAKYRLDATMPDGLSKGDVVLFLQYQMFPWNFTTALQAKGVQSIITSSMKPMDHWATDADIDYINPFWEVQDAAVDVPGYDIKILPTSGILQSVVYWQLVGLT
ncbi:MAG: hypothetical protein ABI210_07720, partial [Abditibacteriaceae bacterium]